MLDPNSLAFPEPLFVLFILFIFVSKFVLYLNELQVPVALVVPGMVDDQMVFAQSSNLYFGTDLLSDSTRISLLDMASVNGSDTIRMVARYTAGVVQGIGADIVRQS